MTADNHTRASQPEHLEVKERKSDGLHRRHDRERLVDQTRPVDPRSEEQEIEMTNTRLIDREFADTNDFDDEYENEPFDHEPYEEYAAYHDPEWAEAWTDAAPRANARPSKHSTHEELEALTDGATGLEAGFETTYTPSRYERTFLLEAIRYFYDIGLIEDVLASVKGGKEASVYRCRPNSMLGVEYVAAKVYRPRRFRNLRNDKMYREGREVLSATGKTVKANERRFFAALKKKTAFGVQAAHTSWMMHEYAIMDDLYNAGAMVPKPYAVSENAILMDYVGDGVRAAPTLHEIDLDNTEARSLFDAVMDNVERMMKLGVIHGDLSAYNILYWNGSITLIDFPQVTDVYANPHARQILTRDLQRVCDYFSVRGVRCNAEKLADDLWQRFNPANMRDVIADLSRGSELELEEE